MRYLVVVEQGIESFGAYVPDLPGCVAVGDTRDEVLKLIHEAIEFHLEGLRERGLDGVRSCTSVSRSISAQRNEGQSMSDVIDIVGSVAFWIAVLRIATPLIFGTLGVLLCERAGVLNGHRRHHGGGRVHRLARGVSGR